ncbi:MAG: serine hydrolase, partial [Deltaproteobacteria bacterium]|nr:serine hydrolase [Deltaproteobacteria bacterium]
MQLTNSIFERNVNILSVSTIRKNFSNHHTLIRIVFQKLLGLFSLSKSGKIILSFLIIACLTFVETAEGEPVFPDNTWESKAPEAVGLKSAKLNQFVSNVGGHGVIVKDGYIVKAWGNYTAKFDWASARKPIYSTMLFFAVHEGKLSGVDDLIVNWGWPLTTKDLTMTFRHLANMTSGYARGELPGEAWAYNGYAISLYAKTLFDRVFNEGTPNDVVTKSTRLGALQFQDGSVLSTREGYGLYTSPRDFARIGWFWLNNGNWNGIQILPESFFDVYVKPDVPGVMPRTVLAGTDYLGVGTLGGGDDATPYGPGIYGFNWWFNGKVGATENRAWPDAPLDTYQANGHWNKEVLTVIPSLNMVVAYADGIPGAFAPGDPNHSMNQNLKILTEAVMISTCTDLDGDTYFAEGGDCGQIDCNDANASI